MNCQTSSKQTSVTGRWSMLVVLTTLAILLLPVASAAQAGKPRLVLQITVDALRGDLPMRYSEHYGEGGFRYLFEQGKYFTNAHYQHANTETIVGHTSLATGSVPAAHGMVANVWYDRELGRLVYNIEDADYQLLSRNADVNQDTEIDPTQRAAKVEGRSPNGILTSTFSDEIQTHYAGQSKVFAVSVKDRGAVSLAGHMGKAFWFSKAAGEFVTSNYYYDSYPEWVTRWNDIGVPARYADTTWSLMGDHDQYLFGGRDDQAWETALPGFGGTFPHHYGGTDNPYFTTFLTLSPAGDEITLDFAKTLLVEEGLGLDEVPDFLAISFSSNDYVCHIFGPSSLEAEDNLRRLDRTLAKLFAFVDEKVGLENTLIVLSADHGSPDAPGYLNDLGMSGPHYFDMDAVNRTPAIQALTDRFGVGEELIESFFHPYLFLNRELIAEHGLDQAEVETAVANELNKLDGVELAVSSSALREGRTADTLLIDTVKHNFHPKRSGDIYIVMEPNVFINDFDGLVVASTHGAPWSSDTYVPVFFAGAGIEPGRFARPITPYDIAPTLSAFLDIKPPSGAIGNPLPEVLGQ